MLINFLECWQVDKEEKTTKFSWVTDLTITMGNAADFMRAGRVRWKIENETFISLNNQGYNLGHTITDWEKRISAGSLPY